MKWLDIIKDVGERAYTAIELARALSGGGLSEPVNPMYHRTSSPYNRVTGVRRIVKSDAPRDAFLDTTGQRGEIEVPYDGKTGFSRRLNRTLSKLEGFTTKL